MYRSWSNGLRSIKKVSGDMTKVVFLLHIILFISATSATANVQFLRGVPRLNSTALMDYYFTCNTVGRTLQWEVNGNGLGGFDFADKVPDVLADERLRLGFNFTATLLSVQNITEEQSSYDSVLIVSSPNSLSLNVTCRNGSIKSSIDNSVQNSSIRETRNNSEVYLQYLFSHPIINMNSTSNLTSVFVCGVENFYMIVGQNKIAYRINESDVIGTHHQNLTQSNTVVTQQAILLCHEPHRLVTVFFSTSEKFTVTCGYPENTLQISNILNIVPMETTSESSEITMTEGELVPETSFGTSSAKPLAAFVVEATVFVLINYIVKAILLVNVTLL